MKMSNKVKNLTGQIFGKWTVLSYAGVTSRHISRWLCLCNCKKATERIVSSDLLTRGRSKSCGCENKGRFSHGYTYHPLYIKYKSIKDRCYNKNNEHYKDYGGRGIFMCKSWKENPRLFIEWALANGYKKELEIERKNNNRGYAPWNCYFATEEQQARNKRNNVVINAFGESKIAIDWAKDKRCNISHRTLRARIHAGWNSEQAVTEKPWRN